MEQLINMHARIRRHPNERTQGGFSTLEMLIAMTLITLALTSVILVSFGSQSMAADGQTGSEALSVAQGMLEYAQASARKDFDLVNPIATTTVAIGGFPYKTELFVSIDPTHRVKNVTAKVTWTGEHNRELSTSLSALVTDFDNAIGGDTCNSVLAGNWASPTIKNIGKTDLSTLAGPGGFLTVNGLFVASSTLYVTIGSTTSATDPTLLIFNVTDPANPVLLGKLDNATSTKDGLTAVAVAKDTISGKTYAYVTNDHTANYPSCAPYNNCSQIQVIDVTDPATLSQSSIVKNVKISPFGTSGFQGTGKSLVYRNGFLYVGLVTGGGGQEFHIVDVHNPLSPIDVASVAVGSTVNAVVAKKTKVYLATTNSVQELRTIDITNPSFPVTQSTFDPLPSDPNNGKSLAVVGDRAYLGRTKTISGTNQITIVDVSSSTLPVATGTAKTLGSSVNGLLVRDHLAFAVTTGGELQVWEVGDPSAGASALTTLSLPASAGGATALACEGNTLYTVQNDASANGSIAIITTP